MKPTLKGERDSKLVNFTNKYRDVGQDLCFLSMDVVDLSFLKLCSSWKTWRQENQKDGCDGSVWTWASWGLFPHLSERETDQNWPKTTLSQPQSPSLPASLHLCVSPSFSYMSFKIPKSPSPVRIQGSLKPRRNQEGPGRGQPHI